MALSLHEAIGKIIKRTRIEQAISTGALGRYLNRPRSQIEAIERGEQGLTVFMLFAVADALNCKPHELLPSRDQVVLPKNGRQIRDDVEQYVADALLEDDPEASKQWVVALLTDSLLVNLGKRSVKRRKRKKA